MRVTENFQSIIDKLELSDLSDLYSSAYNEKKQGSFECFKNHVSGHYYIKCTYLYDTLLLKNNQAKKSFLETLEQKMNYGTINHTDMASFVA